MVLNRTKYTRKWCLFYKVIQKPYVNTKKYLKCSVSRVYLIKVLWIEVKDCHCLIFSTLTNSHLHPVALFFHWIKGRIFWVHLQVVPYCLLIQRKIPRQTLYREMVSGYYTGMKFFKFFTRNVFSYYKLKKNHSGIRIRSAALGDKGITKRSWNIGLTKTNVRVRAAVTKSPVCAILRLLPHFCNVC